MGTLKWLRARPEFWLVCLYAAALLAFVDLKPLWLDELIQLEATAGTTVHTLLRHVRENAGGAPLGYLGQHWLIAIAGCSIRTARMLSVFAAAGSMALLLLLAKRTGLSRPAAVLAGVLWALCPLAFRYSLEGRPYMQALLFVLLAALAEIELSRTGKFAWAFALAICLTAAVYSQPFAIFASLGFSAANIWQRRDWKYAGLTGACYGIVALCFLPWVLTANAQWAAAIVSNGGAFAFSPLLFLGMFRELMGDGYFAAVPAALLAVYGARRRKGFELAAPVISTIVLVLVADAIWNYFFAIRQMIYILPFLLLLMADGVTKLWKRRETRFAAVILLFVFTGASVAKNHSYITDRDEDWGRLAEALMQLRGEGCILLPEGDAAERYAMFRPEITRHLCGLAFSGRVVMPMHQYIAPRARQAAEAALSKRSMSQVSSRQFGFAAVQIFNRAE